MKILLVVAFLLMQGCVATRMTTPDGMELTRVSLWNDVEVRASRTKDGAMKVEETQAGGDAAAALLDLINAAAARAAP